jgi:hypothetical protein
VNGLAGRAGIVGTDVAETGRPVSREVAAGNATTIFIEAADTERIETKGKVKGKR